jgi:hypothetical protein
LEDVVEPWIGDLMPALKAAIDSSQSTAAVKADDATDAQPSSTTPADDVAQAMYGLSLDAASSPAAAAAAATPADATTAAPVKKKIIIRRAPQKEVPDLAPCPYTLDWAEQTTTTAPTYAPAIPASMPAASPLLSAELVGARYLSATDAVKPVLEVELRVPSDSGTPVMRPTVWSAMPRESGRHAETQRDLGRGQVSSGCPAMRLRSCVPTPRTKSHTSSTD